MTDTASKKKSLQDDDIATYARRGGPGHGAGGTDADAHAHTDVDAVATDHDTAPKAQTDVQTDKDSD